MYHEVSDLLFGEAQHQFETKHSVSGVNGASTNKGNNQQVKRISTMK